MKKNVLFLLLFAFAANLMVQGNDEGNPLGVDSIRVKIAGYLPALDSWFG